MSQIIRSGTVDERDRCGTKTLRLTFFLVPRGNDDGDAHPVHAAARRSDGRHRLRRSSAAPGGLIELGTAISDWPATRTTTNCFRTLERIGFIQRGEKRPSARSTT